jgi:hypothetical protein
MEQVKELVSNTLTDKSKEHLWNTFLDCKSELRGITPLDEWDLRYEKDLASHRLEFLNSFIKSAQMMFTMRKKLIRLLRK